MSNALRWKETVGPWEARPGHWDLWGYWSTDGLGLFEFLLLAEELGAEPVWVVNSGVAHADSESGVIPPMTSASLLTQAGPAVECVPPLKPFHKLEDEGRGACNWAACPLRQKGLTCKAGAAGFQ
jgi:hypothetical protein